jgi:hypothetical protein
MVIFWPTKKEEELKMESIKQEAIIVRVGNSNDAEKIFAAKVSSNFSANPIIIDQPVLDTSKVLQFTGSSPNVKLLAYKVLTYPY